MLVQSDIPTYPSVQLRLVELGTQQWALKVLGVCCPKFVSMWGNNPDLKGIPAINRVF